MSINNIHLIQFKIQGHLTKRGLSMPVYQNSFRRKESNICTNSDTICFCFSQTALTFKCHPE